MWDDIGVRAAGRWNLMPSPRGLALASLSNTVGMPAKFENRTVMDTGSSWRCDAWLVEAAAGFGQQPETGEKSRISQPSGLLTIASSELGGTICVWSTASHCVDAAITTPFKSRCCSDRRT
jgi:hypothetical protein